MTSEEYTNENYGIGNAGQQGSDASSSLHDKDEAETEGVENTSRDLSQSERSTSIEQKKDNIFERASKRIARNPCMHMWTFMIIAIIVSGIGLVVGDFSVSVDSAGWQSRGTTISDRQTQLMLTEDYVEDLFFGGDAVWEDLLTKVQPGWESDDDEESRRRLESSKPRGFNQGGTESLVDVFRPAADRIDFGKKEHRSLPFVLTPEHKRKLQLNLEGNGCDMDFYTSGNLTAAARLWPLWKANTKTASALDSDVLKDICEAEANTQAHLEEKGLCFGCDVGCLPPYSVVLYARLTVDDGFSLSCDELAAAWEPFQASVEDEWITCVEDINAFYDVTSDESLPESCPPYFAPELVEYGFAEDGKTLYTSSIFVTIDDPDALYEEVDGYDRGSGTVSGAYDTQVEDFVEIYLDEVLSYDMMLALSSSVVVATAIILHTRSPFITIMGLMQIILSFPLSFFIYALVFSLNYFPFLNFIGIFVVFALGAGDVFIAVDKWKNAKLLYPNADTEHIAAVAFPDAATSMFLTTTTTAVAFFATAISPVAPIKMFSIFCGLLIILDYIMNMLLVFPALCIYDKAIREKGMDGVSCCMHLSCSFCTKRSDGDNTAPAKEEIERKEVTPPLTLESLDNDGESEPDSLRRAFLFYYDKILHKFRWPLFAACIAALGVCTYFASKLDLPTSSDVRVLGHDVQYEQNYDWRLNLLSTALDKASGSKATLIWGVTPADTGDLNDPDTWSQLVLDKDFDPSGEDSQVYLLDICDDLIAQDFALEIEANFSCSMQKFDAWLQEQAATDQPEDIYTANCNGAAGVPVAQGSFHPCMIAWSKSVEETYVLSYQDKVTIMSVPFASRVRFDDQYDILDDEWNLIEDWVRAAMKEAPEGVNGAFFSSFDFWWYDTSGYMISGAYSSVGIAIACAAFIILAVTRSLVLTLFATVTILYVLVSVTAMLVALGWTLGFLESVCFAILIGVSVDFVIHFSYAYSVVPGDADRSIRTKHALLSMGRSILSTALATIISSCLMLFTVILFFQKFGLVLVLTILQACIGSFVMFLSMVDCVGPKNPTYLADKLVAKCKGERRNSNE